MECFWKLLRRVLNLHSPSKAMLGKCRCAWCNRPSPHLADLVLKPGKSTLRVWYEGCEDREPSLLVLVNLGWIGGEIAEAEFQSRAQYMAERTIERNHKPWCTQQYHSVAEGCRP